MPTPVPVPTPVTVQTPAPAPTYTPAPATIVSVLWLLALHAAGGQLSDVSASGSCQAIDGSLAVSLQDCTGCSVSIVAHTCMHLRAEHKKSSCNARRQDILLATCARKYANVLPVTTPHTAPSISSSTFHPTCPAFYIAAPRQLSNMVCCCCVSLRAGCRQLQHVC